MFLPHFFASNNGVILGSYKLITPKGSLARLDWTMMSSVQHRYCGSCREKSLAAFATDVSSWS